MSDADEELRRAMRRIVGGMWETHAFYSDMVLKYGGIDLTDEQRAFAQEGVDFAKAEADRLLNTDDGPTLWPEEEGEE